MARDTRRDDRERRRPPSDGEEPKQSGAYDHVRDYFKLARFRMDFGARHVPSEYWKDRGTQK